MRVPAESYWLTSKNDPLTLSYTSCLDQLYVTFVWWTLIPLLISLGGHHWGLTLSPHMQSSNEMTCLPSSRHCFLWWQGMLLTGSSNKQEIYLFTYVGKGVKMWRMVCLPEWCVEACCGKMIGWVCLGSSPTKCISDVMAMDIKLTVCPPAVLQ